MTAFYLTTPIYYVNATPHLGHAYTMILADAMTRYRKLAGDDVWFLTGTDEHGDKVARAAAQAGVSPSEYADHIAGVFWETWRELGIGNDDFIRTTEPRHQRVVQQILQKLWDAGEIYFGKYGGQYCFGCERFYTEKEIVDGKCPDHQTPLTYIEEENYFFKMSKYQDWLVRFIEDRPRLIRPERYRNEVLGFLREPLLDLSISRPRARLTWGIPLPFDDRFVTYVWFDALINYVSALGEIDGERYRTFWPHARHLIGKDILKPHGVYWPCMLQAAGIPVYAELDVHGYWTVDGQKMSKSLGNVVEPLAMQEKYGEAFRYFLLRESVFGLDSDFSEDALVTRLNADLANDLGNLVSRATTLLVNFGGGAVPAAGPLTAAEEEVRNAFAKARADVEAAMDEFAFHRALTSLWEVLAVLNRYVDATQPWQLARDPGRRPRLDTVLYTLAEALRTLGIVLAPFLPLAAAKIRDAVGERGEPRLADAAWGRLAPGTPVRKLSGLFPRVETEATAKRAPALPASEVAPATSGSRITVNDFGRVELRVAEVVAAEAVPKSRKLLRLTVSLGTETRTVVAGIAEHYAPADLLGKKVVIVANLEAAKLMGIESNGMVLAGSADGRLAVLTPDRDLPPGASVK
ncbi:MAG TPA: methionine--tRNA ligase [Methylomirabilota bacterium]